MSKPNTSITPAMLRTNAPEEIGLGRELGAAIGSTNPEFEGGFPASVRR